MLVSSSFNLQVLRRDVVSLLEEARFPLGDEAVHCALLAQGVSAVVQPSLLQVHLLPRFFLADVVHWQVELVRLYHFMAFNLGSLSVVYRVVYLQVGVPDVLVDVQYVGQVLVSIGSVRVL